MEEAKKHMSKHCDVIISDGDKFRVILHHVKNGNDSRTIDAKTSKNGGVTVGGYDIGPIVEEHFGHFDYEYDATVATEDKYALYTVLKNELFNNGHGEFSSWISDNGVVDVEAEFNVVLLLMIKKLGLYPHDFAKWAKEHDIEVDFWSY